MVTRVLVSPDALSGLTSRLRNVQQSLDDDVRPSAADVGQPELAEALADFSRNWGKRRRELAEDLADASQCLVNAREQFVAADSSLAQSLGGVR